QDERREEEGAGDQGHQEERPPRPLARPGDVAIERADDLVDAPDVPDPPVPLGAVRVLVMTTDAIGLHHARRRVAQRRASLEGLESKDRHPVVIPPAGEGRPFSQPLARVGNETVGFPSLWRSALRSDRPKPPRINRLRCVGSEYSQGRPHRSNGSGEGAIAGRSGGVGSAAGGLTGTSRWGDRRESYVIGPP